MDSYLDLGACYYDSIRAEPPEEAYVFYRSYVSDSLGLILEPRRFNVLPKSISLLLGLSLSHGFGKIPQVI